MAGGTINLLFRVSKDGDGLEKMSKGLENAKGKMTDMGKAAAALGHTMGGVNNAFGQMAKSLLTGGVWMLVAQGIMLLIDKWREYKNAAAEAANEAARNLSESLSNAAESINKKFQKIYDTIARIGVRLKEANRGFGSAFDTFTSVAVSRVNDNTRARLSDAHDDQERAVIKADAQVEIAKIKYAQAEQKAASAVEEAEKEQKLADRKISEAKKKVENLTTIWAQAVNELNRTFHEQNDDTEEFDEAQKAHQKAVNDLESAKAEVAKLEEERRVKETEALVARQKSTQDAIAASEAVKEAEFQLAEAKRKQKEAAEARAKEEKKKAAAEKKEADAEAEAAAKARLESEMVQREQAQEDAEFEARQNMIEYYDLQAEQGKKHLRETLPKMKRLDAQIDALTLRLKKAQEGIARTGRGQAADAKHTNGLFGLYEYGGRANGGENFTDWQRAQRFAQWGDRDAQKAARRDAAAQRRYDRLAEEQSRGRKLSDRDRGFMRDFEAFQDQKNGAANLQQQLEKAQQARDKLQQEIDKTLKSIDQNIKDALAIA
jgi:hypothetical protein